MATGIPVGEKGVTSKVSIKMSQGSPQLQLGGHRGLAMALSAGSSSACGLRSPGEGLRPPWLGPPASQWRSHIQVPGDSFSSTKTRRQCGRVGRAVGALGCGDGEEQLAGRGWFWRLTGTRRDGFSPRHSVRLLGRECPRNADGVRTFLPL